MLYVRRWFTGRRTNCRFWIDHGLQRTIYIATYPSNIEEVEVEFIMIRQIEEGDTKGGIIIPKDKFNFVLP